MKSEEVYPQRVGRIRHGRVVRFTRCCTVLKSNIRYPQSKVVHWDADMRWHKGLYMWAEVENEHGLTANIGLLVPVRVIDDVLDKVPLPRLSIKKRHEICVNPKWVVTDEDDENYENYADYEKEVNTYINRDMLLTVLNKNCNAILWQCDDENGRVVYELKHE